MKTKKRKKPVLRTKMHTQELQEYLYFKKRHSVAVNKKKTLETRGKLKYFD